MDDSQYNRLGVEAIEYFQAMGGYTIDTNKAKVMWENMSEYSKDFFINVYTKANTPPTLPTSQG